MLVMVVKQKSCKNASTFYNADLQNLGACADIHVISFLSLILYALYVHDTKNMTASF
jgi:hypothetical protein